MVQFPTYQDLDELFQNPKITYRAMNFWPPLWGSSIRILDITRDYRRIRVRLSLNRITANYLGTLYGGSLFSMCDPWWVMMVSRALGREYSVWDKSAHIEFLRPGRQHVFAEFHLTDQVLNQIRDGASDGHKHLQWFTTEIITAKRDVIARVHKELYVRRRPAAASQKARRPVS
ncbi:MAG: DUF4442 domain-containing protein [Bowdeniella nasicola]|nr:DUF4442 domain-containing protein [Bowdeniella nasicola]